MNIEEMKAYLEANGYIVRKKNPLPKLLPCTCGSDRRDEVFMICGKGTGRTQYRCQKCGFKGYSGKTERKAREAWNQAVMEAEQNEAKVE